MKKKTILSSIALCVAAVLFAANGDNVIDEVAWMIGDEPIYKSVGGCLYHYLTADTQLS